MKKVTVLKVLLAAILCTSAFMSCEKDIEVQDIQPQESVMQNRTTEEPPPGEDEDVDLVSVRDTTGNG